jgi:hypothetical protein
MVLKPSFEYKPGSLRVNLKNFNGDINALVAGVVDYRGARSVDYMKNNAPWKDRTGNARATLGAYGVHAVDYHEIHLHGGVPYQIWLEVRWSGRYAIISKAVKFQGLALMNQLRGLIAKLGKGI